MQISTIVQLHIPLPMLECPQLVPSSSACRQPRARLGSGSPAEENAMDKQLRSRLLNFAYWAVFLVCLGGFLGLYQTRWPPDQDDLPVAFSGARLSSPPPTTKLTPLNRPLNHCSKPRRGSGLATNIRDAPHIQSPCTPL